MALENEFPPGQILDDYRFAYSTPKPHETDTVGEARAKTLLKKNPKEFMDRLERMEKDYRAQLLQHKKIKATSPSEQAQGAEDVGTAECIKLVEKLIEDLTKEARAKHGH